MDALLEILKEAGRDIAKEFRLASIQGEGSPDEIAEYREGALEECLRQFYPQSYIVEKNQITALDGTQSASIDCLIINPAHPRLFDASRKKFRIVFADGCDAAIDVKPNLARTDELERALRQCISVKKTKRSKSAASIRPAPAHLHENGLRIPFFVFCVRAFEPNKLFADIAAYYRDNSVPLEEQIDGICINGLGIVRQVKHAERNPYGRDSHLGNQTGWYFEVWGDATLIGFLLNLEQGVPSVLPMTDSILGRALRTMSRTLVIRLGNIVQGNNDAETNASSEDGLSEPVEE